MAQASKTGDGLTDFYSPTMADILLKKITRRGWNVYDATNADKIGTEFVINVNLVEKLEMNRRYVLFPNAANPRDPEQVEKAFERVVKLLRGDDPPIILGGKGHPLDSFILEAQNVTVITDMRHYVSYMEFLQALNSIIAVK
jgi:hypothetical protein